jgi:hypothetical protein
MVSGQYFDFLVTTFLFKILLNMFWPLTFLDTKQYAYMSNNTFDSTS